MMAEAPVSTDDIKNFIIGVFKANPAPHTHAAMYRKLAWLADHHRIAMVMNSLAAERVLEHDGADDSQRKRYTYRRMPG